ncbi:hypothetical protein EYC84_005457 [Monilinia fructicola]|uniref:Uncharacterized protein n=1 Tax=Monilinia fructicola TaxID=38448 RepID=A0A5M9K1Q1_MONFR|nr:hypothetical protein EYC84_005457 [Monilinia fructicola]
MTPQAKVLLPKFWPRGKFLSSPAKNSPIPVKKVNSKVAVKDTKYNQPDSSSSARPAQDDSTKTAQSFDFRTSQQKDFSASLERSQPVFGSRSQTAAMEKSTLDSTVQSNERMNGGSTPSREEKEELKSPATVSPSSDVPASVISQTQTQTQVEVAPPSVVTDEGTISVESNIPATEVIAKPEESTLVPSATVSARSCSSRTPSLSDDHSTTSDERMVDAPQVSQEASTDPADAGPFTEEMFHKELERTKSMISTMQHDVIKIKEENKETKKKIENYQQKIDTLALVRDVLKENHASNAAEIHRLEEKIESVETYKQATEILIECYKVKESKE